MLRFQVLAEGRIRVPAEPRKTMNSKNSSKTGLMFDCIFWSFLFSADWLELAEWLEERLILEGFREDYLVFYSLSASVCLFFMRLKASLSCLSISWSYSCSNWEEWLMDSCVLILLSGSSDFIP
jgi:hypothetical protein